MPKPKHAGHTTLNTWVPDDLAARLDAHLEAHRGGHKWLHPSRPDWIREAIEEKIAAEQAKPARPPGPPLPPQPPPPPARETAEDLLRELWTLVPLQQHAPRYHDFADWIGDLKLAVQALREGREGAYFDDDPEGEYIEVADLLREVCGGVPIPKPPRKKKAKAAP